MRTVVVACLLAGVPAAVVPAGPCNWEGASKFPQDCQERRRVWKLWGNLTKLASPAIPVWQVWCGLDEFAERKPEEVRCSYKFVYAKGTDQRRLGHLRPSRQRGDGSETGTQSPISSHFNPALVNGLLSYAQHGPKNWLTSLDRRKTVAAATKQSHLLLPFGEQPPQRVLDWSAQEIHDNVPIAVKAQWIAFDRDTVCANSRKATMPVYRTPGLPAERPYPMEQWPDHVVLDFSSARQRLGCPTSGYRKPTGQNVRPITDFHWFLLQEKETVEKLKGSDIMVLAALHLAVRDRKDWTWSTFWWSPTPQADFGADRPKEQLRWAPWNHYVMNTTFEEAVNGKLKPMFNPYLEAEFAHGRESNCLNCHKLAAVRRKMPEQAACDFPIDQAKLLKLRGAHAVLLSDYLWFSFSGGDAWDCTALRKLMALTP